MWRFLRRLVLLLLLFAVVVLAGFRLAAVWRESGAVAAPEHGRFVETASGRIFVLEYGPDDGMPILFAHGTAAWSELWRPTLKNVADQGFRAIAYDAPPFGYSDRLNVPYTRQSLAQVVLDLTNAMDIRPFLVAHSFGAGPGVEAVMMDQTRFSGLVVVDGAMALNSHNAPKTLPFILKSSFVRELAAAGTMNNPLLTRRLLAGLIHVKAAATDGLAEMLAQPFQRSGTTQAYASWLPALLATPVDALSTRTENYETIMIPVAYIWGAEDTVTPLAQGEALQRVTPGTELIVLAGVGHIPQIEDPEAFQAALINVLTTFRVEAE